MTGTPEPQPARRVLIVDADPALEGLLGEWLAAEGLEGVSEREGGSVRDGFSLVIVDVPFPRQGGTDALRRVAERHPGAPILALSSGFFTGIESRGAVARSLGVAAVLAKPLSRDALIAGVARALEAR